MSEPEKTERGSPPAGVGTLFLVSTPIGNLGDMTFRAVETLKNVSLILCEDTRHSRRLLDHFSITTSVSSYHEHNEARETPRIVARLASGDDVALISDAGTPLLSDPGARLVRAALDDGARVSAIPGASALLAALVSSGLPADAFTFVGFLPRKGKERRARLEMLSALTCTAVLYEAPGRVSDTLDELAALDAGNRKAVVARELTKQFEEVQSGTVRELAEYYREAPPRGEVVVVIEGRAPTEIDESMLRESARSLRAEGATTREIVRSLVELHGAPRNLAYRLAQDA
ncbi:MAG: 16S rRNA (cytidine(1402)-2'-O)-methyltransferase [Gemmatimonadaceae bacterium]